MATGATAFSGNTRAELHEAILNRTPVPARKLNPELPRELQGIIEKALEKDREVRYQTAAEMCADLQRLCDASEPAINASHARRDGSSIIQKPWR